jgi:hydrogenase maturation protease
MSKVLVVGYGNQLRSDDSVGPQAVRELKQQLADTEVEYIECHQLNIELSQPISEAELVIFVDASTDGISGEIHYENIKPGDAATPTSMSHHVDPAILMTAAKQLYGKAPEAIVATVTGECFGFGRELSPEVASAMHGVVHHLKDLIREKLSKAVAAD